MVLKEQRFTWLHFFVLGLVAIVGLTMPQKSDQATGDFLGNKPQATFDGPNPSTCQDQGNDPTLRQSVSGRGSNGVPYTWSDQCFQKGATVILQEASCITNPKGGQKPAYQDMNCPAGTVCSAGQCEKPTQNAFLPSSKPLQQPQLPSGQQSNTLGEYRAKCMLTASGVKSTLEFYDPNKRYSILLNPSLFPESVFKNSCDPKTNTLLIAFCVKNSATLQAGSALKDSKEAKMSLYTMQQQLGGYKTFSCPSTLPLCDPKGGAFCVAKA